LTRQLKEEAAAREEAYGGSSKGTPLSANSPRPPGA